MLAILSDTDWPDDDRRSVGELVSLLAEEASAPPLHYSTEEIARRLRSNVMPRDTLIRLLRESGFTATRTHFSPTGIRTDATFTEIADLCRDVIR
jgi:tRNA (guanine26-N2/guanine27-N2)-dimethyltransferase